MPASPTVTIAPARLPEDIGSVRQLFTEYVDSLGV